MRTSLSPFSSAPSHIDLSTFRFFSHFLGVLQIKVLPVLETLDLLAFFGLNGLRLRVQFFEEVIQIPSEIFLLHWTQGDGLHVVVQWEGLWLIFHYAVLMVF